MQRRGILVLFVLVGFWGVSFAGRAPAPVVDLNDSSSQELASNRGLEIDQDVYTPKAPPSHQHEPVEQRVLRLERQIANLTEMNMASKIEKMQLDMQQLHGQMEVQNHDIFQLKDQIHNFYQDLDQRLSKIKPSTTSSSEKKPITVENSNKGVTEEIATETPSKAKELQTYETAFNLLNKQDYNKAVTGFQTFLKDYPSSTYTVNAHYWLGEIYYLKSKPDQASKEFQIVISNYPEHPKVADAMLKIALISMDAGNYTKAKQNLTKVQKQFPNSTAAKIATLRLKEIKQKN